MVEYIKREDAINWFLQILKKPGDIYPTDITTMLQSIPPADVRPVKHGKWIVKTDSEGKTYGVCSCCGYKQYAGHLKYCPECGGKMDGPNQ